MNSILKRPSTTAIWLCSNSKSPIAGSRKIIRASFLTYWPLFHILRSIRRTRSLASHSNSQIWWNWFSIRMSKASITAQSLTNNLQIIHI